MSIVKMERVIGTLYDELHWESVAPGGMATVAYPAFEKILIRENVLSTDRTAKQKWKILYTSKLATEYAAKAQQIYLDIDKTRAFLNKTGTGFTPYTKPTAAECVRACVCVATEAKE